MAKEEEEEIDITTQLAKNIQKQINFYFSDSNYPKDKFLIETAKANDGWIPLSTIATFSRMKSMSKNIDLISAVARTVDSAVVNEDGDKIKRKNPLPDTDTIDERSLYIKGFPTTDKVTIETISVLFPEGDVLSVRLMRNKEKKFLGKAFVEFTTHEKRDTFVDCNFTYGDDNIPLTYETKIEFLARQKMKKKNKKDQKTELKKRQRLEQENIAEKFKFKPNLLVKVTNISANTDREDCKDTFSKYGKIAYIDMFERSNNIAIIRFSNAEESEAAINAIKDNEVEINNIKLEAELMEVDEEEKYWKEKITPFANVNNHLQKKRKKI